MTIKFKQLVEGIKPETKKEVQQIDEQIEIVEEETVEVQKEAKTYSTFSQWLTEACKKMKEDKVELHDGDEDGKRLGEETEEIEEGQKVKTSTGYIHKGTYGSEYETDEEGNEKKKEAPAVKRGRGRPKKGSDETGNVKKFTIHPALAKFGAPRK